MIKQIENKIAKEYMEQNHYTKSCALGIVSYGWFEGDEMVGAIVFSQPAGKFTASGIWNGGNMKNTLEFIRMFLLDEASVKESEFISKAISQLRQDMPQVKVLVTYADQQAGHIGYIYQATNWMYIGTAANERKIFIDGERVHRRSLNSKYGTSSIPKLQEILKAEGKTIQVSDERYSKHKYIYIIPRGAERKRVMKALKVSKLPYPKGDVTKYDGDTNVFHQLDTTPTPHPHQDDTTPTSHQGQTKKVDSPDTKVTFTIQL